MSLSLFILFKMIRGKVESQIVIHNSSLCCFLVFSVFDESSVLLLPLVVSLSRNNFVTSSYKSIGTESTVPRTKWLCVAVSFNGINSTICESLLIVWSCCLLDALGLYAGSGLVNVIRDALATLLHSHLFVSMNVYYYYVFVVCTSMCVFVQH